MTGKYCSRGEIKKLEGELWNLKVKSNDVERTVAITTDDMQKRRNDVKERTTLLLALPDEHQLRFSKYKTAQELWAAILKTFGGNEATKKTKKNLLKQQYGNFKAEGLETLEQTFNRLQAIVSHLEFIDIEIEQDDLNQKFLTSLSPEWLMHMIIKYEDINQIDEDDIEEMYIKWNMALLSMRADRYWKKTGKKIYIQRTDVAGFDKSKVEEQAPKALMAIDGIGYDWSFMANEEENHALVSNEEAPTEFALMAKSTSDDESQRSDKNKEGLGYSVVPPPPAQVYSPPKKDMSWTGLPEFANDTITDYSRPSPAIESNSDDFQNRNPSVAEFGASSSTILSKPSIKFVKSVDRPTETKTDKVKTAKKPAVKYVELYRKTSKSTNVRGNQRNWNNVKSHQLVRTQSRVLRVPTVIQKFPNVNRKFPTVNKKFPTGNTKFSTADLGNKGKAGNSQINIDDKGYWDSGCSRHMTGNISYLSDYEPFDGEYVSFGQGGCTITGKGTIKTDLQYNLFSVSQICDNKNSVLFTDSECIVLGRNFKLTDDTNVLLSTPRQHNMYSIDLNNVVTHKYLTCLVAKASVDECMLWYRRLGHLNSKTTNRKAA
nr:hypothetical protein [Tanacetum cinerariifolium]